MMQERIRLAEDLHISQPTEKNEQKIVHIEAKRDKLNEKADKLEAKLETVSVLPGTTR